MVTVEEDYAALRDRIVERTKIVLIQRREYPAILGDAAGTIAAHNLLPALVFVELHEDARVWKCVEVSRMVEMQVRQHQRVDVAGRNAVAGKDVVAPDEVLEAGPRHRRARRKAGIDENAFAAR